MPRRNSKYENEGRYDSSESGSETDSYEEEKRKRRSNNKRKNNRKGNNSRGNSGNSRENRRNNNRKGKKGDFFQKKKFDTFSTKKFEEEYEQKDNQVLPPMWDEVPKNFGKWFDFQEGKEETFTLNKKKQTAYRFYFNNQKEGGRRPKFVLGEVNTKGIEQDQYGAYQVPSYLIEDTANPTKMESKRLAFIEKLNSFVKDYVFENQDFFGVELDESDMNKGWGPMYWTGVGKKKKGGKRNGGDDKKYDHPNPMIYGGLKCNKKTGEIWTDCISYEDKIVNPHLLNTPHKMTIVVELESVYIDKDGDPKFKIKYDTLMVGPEIRRQQNYSRGLIRKMGLLRQEEEKPQVGSFVQQMNEKKKKKQQDSSSSSEEESVSESEEKPKKKNKKSKSPRKKSPKREESEEERSDSGSEGSEGKV